MQVEIYEASVSVLSIDLVALLGYYEELCAFEMSPIRYLA